MSKPKYQIRSDIRNLLVETLRGHIYLKNLKFLYVVEYHVLWSNHVY